MPFTEMIFWISLSVLFFCYLGYGILLWFFQSVKRLFHAPGMKKMEFEMLPVTLIVASYNEADVLEAKIRNSLSIHYRENKLHFIFIVDGSNDDSEKIIRNSPHIQLIIHPDRKGKMAAIKTAMQRVKTPLVAFSDANAMLNEDCLLKMVAHFSDPQVGGVAGEKKIIHHAVQRNGVSEAESLYWKYESFMKKLDAGFYTVIGAAGELFCARTALLNDFDETIILDDFINSMQVCLKGYRIAYEPGAYASESASASLAEEEKRKVRIAAGAYQAIGRLWSALNFFKRPLLSFQYLVRRFLRWTACPLFIITLFLSNLLIVIFTPGHHFYFWFLGLQCIFYMMAYAGWMRVKNGKKASLLTIPFYFVFMNYCLIKGWIKYLRGRHSVLWEKSKRAATL
jgi:biofilm PGA synthesis N-glycosyltransferase PgaC